MVLRSFFCFLLTDISREETLKLKTALIGISINLKVNYDFIPTFQILDDKRRLRVFSENGVKVYVTRAKTTLSMFGVTFPDDFRLFTKHEGTAFNFFSWK
jgi:hypothetical protein